MSRGSVRCWNVVGMMQMQVVQNEDVYGPGLAEKDDAVDGHSDTYCWRAKQVSTLKPYLKRCSQLSDPRRVRTRM